MFDLSGKTAVITGSSRGIGQAIAERLAQHGARVVISSRKQDSCETVAAAINAECGDPQRAIAIAASLSSKEQLQQLIEQSTQRLGKVDILVCNAASNPHFGSMSTLDDAVFRKVLDNNIVANHWLCQAVAPQMIERNDGVIIIISSIGGVRGSSVIGAYNISKAADMQLARNLAVEWGAHNIRVNCIAPGLVKTEFARALWENPEILKRMTHGSPLRRIGLPDEIAGAAVYLAGAGSFITGQSLHIDGGASIG